MEFVGRRDEKVYLKISGNAMDAALGFELKYLLGLLQGVEDLIEKTYLFSKGRIRMTSEDYNNLKIIIDEPKRGSFDANIFIQVLDNVLAISPLLAENGVAIWQSIKQVYEYLKLVIDTRKEGKEVEITQSGDHNIIVQGDNNTITVNKHTPDLAKNLSPYITKMTKNIDDENISGIELNTEEDTGFNLTAEDKERFRSKTFLNDEYTNYEGKIVSSDSKRHKGEIETDNGTFTYYIHDSIASERVHDEIYLKNVLLECREKVKIDPSKETMEEILSLEVYDFQIL